MCILHGWGGPRRECSLSPNLNELREPLPGKALKTEEVASPVTVQGSVPWYVCCSK